MSAQKVFFGWIVVAAAFVVASFGWGLGFYGPPIYLNAVETARGWSVTWLSICVSLHFLIGAAVVTRLPRLHARFGIPIVTSAGSVTLAIGICGWALSAEPWHLLAASALSGAGWVALGAAGINAMIAPWFERNRPTALSMAYNGASIGGVVFSPLWVLLIETIGFSRAAIAVGAIMIAVITAISIVVLTKVPAALGLRPDGDTGPVSTGRNADSDERAKKIGTAWSDDAFRSLALAMALSLFAQIGLIAHLFSLLVPVLGSYAAGLAAGLSTAAAIVGRMALVWFVPAGSDRRSAAAWVLALQALGSAALLLSDGQTGFVFAGVLLIGLGIGNMTSLPPLIAQAEFAKPDVAKVVALIVATAQGFYALAPAAFGLLRDFGPSDGRSVFWAAIGVQAVAAAIYLWGRRRYLAR